MHSINYDSPVALRAFLQEQQLGMRKKFGQNFLISPAVRTRLLDALDVKPGDSVWEVGPGLGAMTQGLLERGARVHAFEIDPGFCRLLPELFADNPGFTLVPGDVLKTWQNVEPAQYLLGNLPYTIAAILLAGLIEQGRFFTRLVITVQKEVAKRMCALPGSKNYSSFSVLCSSVYTLHPLPVIKPASFYPAPHVDSQGVRLDLRTDSDPANMPALFRPLVRHLFSARRKTIKNNLHTFLAQRMPAPAAATLALITEALAQCGLTGDVRAEDLALEDFIALARTIETLHIEEKEEKKV